MKQKFKEFKRQLLKSVQSKLRQFLNTEYRTAEEIQQDTMNVYVNHLSKTIYPNDGSYISDEERFGLYVGEISYIQDKEGKCYYKCGAKFYDLNQDENSYTDDELKVKLGLQTEIDKNSV